MQASTLQGHWSLERRAEVRVRVGPYVVLGRVARVAPRAGAPPGPRWGLSFREGRAGYGMHNERARLEHWRPLPPLE